VKRIVSESEIIEFNNTPLNVWTHVVIGKKGIVCKARERFSRKYYDAIYRCTKPTHPLFPHYGGRGLRVEFTIEEFLEWIYVEYPKFILKNGNLSPSLSRIDYNRGYSLDNIALETISENTKELYSRRGNRTPRGTVLDEISVLTCYTINNPFVLSEHYKVSYPAITRILTGRNWKHLYPVFQETDL